MNKNNKGISIVLLVLIVLVAIALLSVSVMYFGNSYAISSVSAFSNDLKDIEDLASAYIIENGDDSLQKITKTEVMSMIDMEKQIEFENELMLNSDNSSNKMFYLVDLTKVGVKKSLRGYSKEGIDDLYVLTEDTMHLYYLKGLKVEDMLYFSLSSKINDAFYIGKEIEIIDYDYYRAGAGGLLVTIGGRAYTKTNNIPAICGVAKTNNWMFPVVVSTDPDGAGYTAYGANIGYMGSFDYNGETYYYSGSGNAMPGNSAYTSNLKVFLNYNQNYTDAIVETAAKDLLADYFANRKNYSKEYIYKDGVKTGEWSPECTNWSPSGTIIDGDDYFQVQNVNGYYMYTHKTGVDMTPYRYCYVEVGTDVYVSSRFFILNKYPHAVNVDSVPLNFVGGYMVSSGDGRALYRVDVSNCTFYGYFSLNTWKNENNNVKVYKVYFEK